MTSSRTKNVSVIIPAAGLATRMRPLSNASSKAMIPINGKPVIYYILSSLEKVSDIKEVIIVQSSNNDIEKWVEQFYTHKRPFKIKFATQDEPNGPLDAIEIGSREIKNATSIMVWLGDTLIDDITKYINMFTLSQDFLFTKAVKHQQDWCIVYPSDDRLAYEDKPEENIDGGEALVGVYYFRDSYKFMDAIEMSKGYYDISNLLEEYAKEYALYDVSEDWYDCGNMINYTMTRADFIGKTSRDMNRIEIDTVRGIVKKSSSNQDTLDVEKAWYDNLSSDMKLFTPTLLNSQKDQIWLTWESGTSLSDMLVYDNINTDTWKVIIDRVLLIMHKYFYQYRAFTGGEVDSESDSFYQYIEKNLFRFKKIINYVTTAIEDRNLVERAIQDFPYLGDVMYCIHGDLHLGNIIFNADNFSFKLLDPRGQWGKTQTNAGDTRYDMAKFTQCFWGGYANILAGQFSYKDDELVVHTRPNQEDISNYLFSQLEDFNYDVDEIKTSAAILIITCIPFHMEDPIRCQAFWDRGVQLLRSI